MREEIEEATQSILIRALFKHEVAAHAMPTQEAVVLYYREHPDQFRVPEQAEVDQVEVSDEQKALAIRNAVLAGQSLAAAAQAQGVGRVDVASVPRGMRQPERVAARPQISRTHGFLLQGLELDGNLDEGERGAAERFVLAKDQRQVALDGDIGQG